MVKLLYIKINLKKNYLKVIEDDPQETRHCFFFFLKAHLICPRNGVTKNKKTKKTKKTL